MIGQEEEQEHHHHHGDQVHRLAFVLMTNIWRVSALVEAGGSCEASNQSAVADDDCEEGPEEAESHAHVVRDQFLMRNINCLSNKCDELEARMKNLQVYCETQVQQEEAGCYNPDSFDKMCNIKYPGFNRV